MSFSERLKKARLEKGFSKSDLAKEIGVHYSQIGRYEDKGAQPAADVLGKLANALEVSSDFLMNGSSDDMANSSLTDKELLNQFKAIKAQARCLRHVGGFSSMLLLLRIRLSSWHCKQKSGDRNALLID